LLKKFVGVVTIFREQRKEAESRAAQNKLECRQWISKADQYKQECRQWKANHDL